MRWPKRRELDGIYVLATNDSTIWANALVAAYRQLREVQETYRVPRILVRLRHVRPAADVRLRSHVRVFITGYLLARVPEHRLARRRVQRPGRPSTTPRT